MTIINSRISLLLSILALAVSGCSGSSSSSGAGGDGGADAGTDAGIAEDAGDTGVPGDVGTGDVVNGGDTGTDGTDAGPDLVVTGSLPGEPGDDAIAAIPDVEPAPHPEDEWTGPPGLALSRTRLVIVVEDDATVGDINSALEAAGAELIGGSPVSGIINASVPDDDTGDNMANAMLALEEAAGVMTAHPESSSVSTNLAKAHDAGAFPRFPACGETFRRWRWNEEESGNWGLRAARVPFAWNLLSRLERLGTPPEVVAFERGWDSGHPDLDMHANTVAGLYANRCQNVSGDEQTNCFLEVEHAMTVGGVLSAGYNDIGIEGVFPATTDTFFALVGLIRGTSEEANRRAVEQAIRNRSARIINYSAGKFYTRDDPAPRPTDTTWFSLWQSTWQDQIHREGIAWNAMIQRLARQRTDFLVTCSAGNDGVKSDFTFQASDTGGCQYAATVLGNDHLLAVENLQFPGDALHASSNRGGNIAAPGTCIGGTGVQNAYVADTGTSFASPFVAGALAVIWALDPGLSYDQVRRALLDGASPAEGGTAKRLDLFGSLRQVDRIRDNDELILEVLDIDDHTADGRLRAEPGGPPRDPAISMGDGCIDMADLRALRDAYVLSRNPEADLDGGRLHAMRDLNGDGYVHATATTSITGAAESEAQYSRFDLNADNRIDGDDFGWLADFWGRCREGAPVDQLQLEGWRAADVYRFELEDPAPTVTFLDSYDVWFEVPATEDLLVRVGGAPARWVSIDHDDAVYRDADGDYWAVVTVPRACSSALPRACSMTRNADGETSELRCVRFDPPPAGGDIIVSPSTGDPLAAGKMLFLGDGLHWDGNPSSPAIQGTGVYTGLDFAQPLELTEIDLGPRPVVTRTGDLALLPACPGAAIGQFETCLWVVDLDDPLEDGDYTRAFLDFPGESATNEVLQFSEDGRTALLQETPYTTDDTNWFLLDLDGLQECPPFGSGGCDPFGDTLTFVEPDVDVAFATELALDSGRRVWFADEDGRIRSQYVGTLVIGEQCIEAPSVVRFEMPGESVQLARAVGGSISADGKALVMLHDGAWVLGYVDLEGGFHQLGRGYAGAPRDTAAWGPGGRTILYRTPENHIVFDHIDDTGNLVDFAVLDNTGDLVDARVSWAPGWSYMAAWSPGSALGGDIGDILVWELSDFSVATARNHDDRAGEPAWSPDGEYLAYGLLFTEDGRSDLDIWTVRLATNSVDFLTNDIQSAKCQGEEDCPYTDQWRAVWGRSLGRLR